MRSRSASLTCPTQRYCSQASAGTSSSTTATSAVTPETRPRKGFTKRSLARRNCDKSSQIKHLTSLTNPLLRLNVLRSPNPRNNHWNRMEKGSHMKKLAVVAAAVLLANIVNIDRAFEAPLAAQDRVAEVRGPGEEGARRRQAGRGQGPQRRGTVPPLDGAARHGRHAVAGPGAPRQAAPQRRDGHGRHGRRPDRRTHVSAFNGTEAWDDIQNRGGMGGGMQMVIRGPGRPGWPRWSGRSAHRRADRTSSACAA